MNLNRILNSNASAGLSAYAELEPFYMQAEALLQVKVFDNEPRLQKLIDQITANDPEWRSESLPLRFKKQILNDIQETKHFDGFASFGAYKSDAEYTLLAAIHNDPPILPCELKKR